MNKLYKVVAAVAALCAHALAQGDQHTAVLVPGDVIKYIFHVEGRDSSFFTDGYCSLQLDGKPLPEQANFTTGPGSTVTPITDKVLRLEIRVPDFIATGTYKLSSCVIRSHDASVSFTYTGEELPHAEVIHVENKRHFEKPQLTNRP